MPPQRLRSVQRCLLKSMSNANLSYLSCARQSNSDCGLSASCVRWALHSQRSMRFARRTQSRRQVWKTRSMTASTARRFARWRAAVSSMARPFSWQHRATRSRGFGDVFCAFHFKMFGRRILRERDEPCAYAKQRTNCLAPARHALHPLSVHGNCSVLQLPLSQQAAYRLGQSRARARKQR